MLVSQWAYALIIPEILTATTVPESDDGNREEITKKLNSISSVIPEQEAEEVDFFADMEPVIKPTNLLTLSATAEEDKVSQNLQKMCSLGKPHC